MTRRLMGRSKADMTEATGRTQGLMALLRSHGFTVDAGDQTEPEMKLDDYDLIIISATTNTYKFGTKYADAGLPVVLLEGKSVDSMNRRGRADGPTTGPTTARTASIPRKPT